MYIPNKYKVTDQKEALAFIKEHSFGILINTLDDKPWGTHLPLQLEKNKNGDHVLQGHIAKRNPQWKNFSNTENVMVIFTGPHTYISSSWYDHEEVPTWNYLAVHVYGKIKIIQGDQLLDHLKSLTNRYESDSQNPVKIENLSDKTMSQINGVVGFEISIDDIHAVQKLSQGKSQENQHSIIDHLSKRKDANSSSISDLMQKQKKSN